jgi:hypothetical protein
VAGSLSHGIPFAFPRSMATTQELNTDSPATLKSDGKMCCIREQILRDEVTGLTLQFEVDDLGRTRVRLYGDSLLFGNRQFGFDHGELTFAATQTVGKCKPAWLTEIGTL